MLIPRIITAIILATLVIAGIFYLPPIWFEILATIIVFLGVREVAVLFWKNAPIKGYVFIFAALLLFLFLELTFPIIGIIVGCCFWVISPYLLSRYTKTEKSTTPNELSKWFIGTIVFIPCLLSIIELKLHFGAKYLLYILLIVWATDIGAYFAGRFFGKNKLAPIISPKKTIEGLIGGLALAFVLAIAGSTFLVGKVNSNLILLTMVASLWSVIGDLFESMLKRQAQVKDSGKLLPGHGGIYDRIDSLTAALPIFVLGLKLIIHG
jgi:phosphatidate cytidylyltransferase